MMLRTKNNSGIILIVVLWIMVILTLLTIGIGWQTHIELTLAKNFRGKVQSKYIALSGLTYAMDLIKNSTNNKDLHKPDVLNSQVFSKTIPLGTGYFKVKSIQDVESRINLNAIDPNNYRILTNLLEKLGIDRETAMTITYSVIDWKDTDKTVLNPPYGAENDFYQEIGYNAKNQPLESVEEILLIRGMNKDIYQKIKDFITIYPTSGALLINIDTASEEVLRAFAENFAGPLTNTSIEDASSLVDKIMEYRRTLTDTSTTAQERAVETNKMSLNSKENSIFLTMQSQRQRTSQYFNIQVVGVDEESQASTEISTTIQIKDLAVLSWHRN